MNFMQKVKVVGGVVVAILLIVIVLQNTEVVETRILFTSISMPRAALLFGTLIAGFGLGVLAAGRLVSSGHSE